MTQKPKFKKGDPAFDIIPCFSFKPHDIMVFKHTISRVLFNEKTGFKYEVEDDLYETHELLTKEEAKAAFNKFLDND